MADVSDFCEETTVTYLDNGDYIGTTIIYYETHTRTATKSGLKTASHKSSDDEALWSVTANGIFTYNVTTSSCTSASHSTTAPESNRSIKISSYSKSGNCASATVTATHMCVYFQGLCSDH